MQSSFIRIFICAVISVTKKKERTSEVLNRQFLLLPHLNHIIRICCQPWILSEPRFVLAVCVHLVSAVQFNSTEYCAVKPSILKMNCLELKWAYKQVSGRPRNSFVFPVMSSESAVKSDGAKMIMKKTAEIKMLSGYSFFFSISPSLSLSLYIGYMEYTTFEIKLFSKDTLITVKYSYNFTKDLYLK